MSAKRALIVDDSRSARMILGRMLETHGLQVDTAESAEQALEYLRSARPDVVFMDHLMPGMDGFDAVRAMKANQQTAAIPVLMYTSQEGEQYLRQARRAGAQGVLSKTLKPSDVSRALYELHLLPDRREMSLPLPRVANAGAGTREESPRPAPMPIPAEAQRLSVQTDRSHSERTPTERAATDRDMQHAVSTLLMEQHAELQQQLQANWETLSAKFVDRVREQVRAMAVTAAPSPAQLHSPRNWFAVVLTIVALIPTAVMAFLYWRTFTDQRLQLQESTARLAMVVTEQQTQIEQLRAELRKRTETVPAPNSIEAAAPVPYGEAPLAGPRIERARTLIDRLQREGFRGVVVLTSFIGDFCLSGSAAAGYALAKESLPARRCDLIGNPFEDSVAAQAPVQSPDFLQWIAASSLATGGAIRIETRAGGRTPAVAYPQQTERLTAGEWNAVALRNNRVEFGLLPASDAPPSKTPAPSGAAPVISSKSSAE